MLPHADGHVPNDYRNFAEKGSKLTENADILAAGQFRRAAPDMFRFKEYTLDAMRGTLRAADAEIELRPKCFEVLRYLVQNANRLVAKEELIKAIWPDVIVTDDSLTQCVSEVRHALRDEEQAIIKTVPRRGYRFAAPVSTSDSATAPVSALEGTRRPEGIYDPSLSPGLAQPSRPSIAILPFINLSGDPQQDCFGDGIAEDIITELSRFSELMVIARNSAFQFKGKTTDVRQIGRELGVGYVLEGSVRKDGKRIRLTAQLIDAATGAHRWAERYDRDLNSVFAIQDEVTRTIVTILALYINKTEMERTRLKPPAAWEAYDYYLRGAEAYIASARDPENVPFSEARRLLQRSLAIDPGYARAYAMLARTWVRSFWDPIDDDYLDPSCIDRAYEFSRKAVLLDENLPLAHFQLGMALLHKRRHDEAVAELDRALALNPNYTDYQFGYGLALAGQSARAIEVLRENLRLDPFGHPSRLCHIGQACYMLERYQEAVTPLRECALRIPVLWSSYIFLAASHAQLGELDRAKTEVMNALRIYPAFTVEKLNRALPYNARDSGHLADGLRKAGLPEI